MKKKFFSILIATAIATPMALTIAGCGGAPAEPTLENIKVKVGSETHSSLSLPSFVYGSDTPSAYLTPTVYGYYSDGSEVNITSEAVKSITGPATLLTPCPQQISMLEAIQ